MKIARTHFGRFSDFAPMTNVESAPTTQLSRCSRSKQNQVFSAKYDNDGTADVDDNDDNADDYDGIDECGKSYGNPIIKLL